MIRQAEAAECGLASIAMIARFHGHEIDLPTIRRRFGLSMKGVTLRTLIDVASALSFSSRPIRCEIDELSKIRLPAILHWGTNHFVVLRRVTRNGIIIHDPAYGATNVSKTTVSRMFTGVALELTPNINFRRKKDTSPIRLSALFSIEGDVSKALLQTVVLSLVVEALLIASPFYLQFVIDDAILKGDIGILQVFALAFGILILFRVAANLLRSLTSQFISNVLTFDMKGRIFHHMIRLPLDWFQKRQLGDIQSRFSSIQAIQAFVSQGALTGILDGILGSAVLVIMFLYSPLLATIIIVSLALYILIKMSSFQLTKRFAADVITSDAREQTRFLETLRASQTIKSSGSESSREGQFRNAAATSINAQIRSGNIALGTAAAEQSLNGLVDIIVIYVGARLVIAGNLTVGMLTAFLAYKGQFIGRFINLFEQLFSWRLLDLQLERIADIVLSPQEERIDYGGYEGRIEGKVECRNIAFRYAFGESLVLQGINIRIEAGECVAIVGSSGSGKSTLAKIITGLYSPNNGEILIDDRPLKNWSTRSLRSQISYVSQDDQLLTGSIAENISFFVENINMDRVRECAHIALIDREISAMPMGYDSLVGDMGSSLSGGQKQRIMIARALYRRPRILIMDEATAHLDIANEQAITHALSELTISRIVIAHRPETIAAADRVISLDRSDR